MIDETGSRPIPVVRVGCCGLPVSREAYFATFPVVEIQQTFYQPPQIKTATLWRGQAPIGFHFTIKAWQLITHEPTSPTYRRLREPLPPEAVKNLGAFKPTDEVLAAWERTREVAGALGAKVVVFQSPASFKPTSQNRHNLNRFFSKIERDNYVLAWEPRGEWQAEDIRRLCLGLHVVHCVDPFEASPVTEGLGYYRLHGRGGFRYRYTQEDFKVLQAKVLDQPEAYVLFNNVNMYGDAVSFGTILKGRTAVA